MPRIVIDGINLYYDKIGNGPIPLLLLPGFLGTVEDDFEPIIKKLDKELFTIVSWDPLGFGRSYPPARTVHTRMYHRDSSLLAEMMKELGFERYHIFGWSGGGQTGLAFTTMYPNRVITLTLFATVIVYEMKNLRLYQAMTKVNYWPKERLETKMKYLEMGYLKEVCTQLCIGFQTRAEQGFRESKEELEPIQCPSLILHGRLDTYVDVSSAHHLHAIMPRSRLHIFPEGGHDYHLTDTDEVLKVWMDFVLQNRN